MTPSGPNFVDIQMSMEQLVDEGLVNQLVSPTPTLFR